MSVDSNRSASTTSHQTVPLAGIALLAALIFFWGINWPTMKLALTEFPVAVFRVLCVWTGGLTLLSIAALTRQRLLPRGRIWWHIIGMAIVNVAMWQVFSAIGLIHLPAGRGVIIAFTMPIWASILSSIFLREPFTARKGFGLLLGLSGMGALIGPDLPAIIEAPIGVLAMLAAALSWATGTVWLKKVDWDLPTLTLTGWQLALSGIPIGLWGLSQGVSFDVLVMVERMTWDVALASLYAVTIPMTFCYWAWFTLVKTLPAAIAAIGTLGIPAVGVFSGALLLGEVIGLAEISALVLVVTGLAVVLLPPLKRR